MTRVLVCLNLCIAGWSTLFYIMCVDLSYKLPHLTNYYRVIPNICQLLFFCLMTALLFQ